MMCKNIGWFLPLFGAAMVVLGCRREAAEMSGPFKAEADSVFRLVENGQLSAEGLAYALCERIYGAESRSAASEFLLNFVRRMYDANCLKGDNDEVRRKLRVQWNTVSLMARMMAREGDTNNAVFCCCENVKWLRRVVEKEDFADDGMANALQLSLRKFYAQAIEEIEGKDVPRLMMGLDDAHRMLLEKRFSEALGRTLRTPEQVREERKARREKLRQWVETLPEEQRKKAIRHKGE